jgi:hypothetical protein
LQQITLQNNRGCRLVLASCALLSVWLALQQQPVPCRTKARGTLVRMKSAATRPMRNPMPHAIRRGASLRPGVRRKTRAEISADKAEKHAWRCYLAVVFSMFLNMLLAIGNANGVGMNNSKVVIIQIIVTLLSGSLILANPIRLKPAEQYTLGGMALLLVIGAGFHGFNPKALYDCLIIPLYIMLGRSARQVRAEWMHWLLAAVVFVVGMEILTPSIFTRIVNPGDYFMATRDWVAGAGSNAAVRDGLYSGAYRGAARSSPSWITAFQGHFSSRCRWATSPS